VSQLLRVIERIDRLLREEVDEQWIKQHLELSQRIIFVDVGARGSLHPIARRFGDYLSLILFEPEKDAAEALRNNYSRTSPITVLQVAAGAKSEIGTLFVTRKPGGSSTRRFGGAMSPLIQRNHPDPSRFEVVATQQIQIERLEHMVSYIDILKIDTQGTAFEVIAGLGSIRPVLIELEAEYGQIYAEQKLIHEISGLLTQLGYFMIENRITPEPLNPNSDDYGLTVRVSGDVIFVPDLSALGQSIVRDRETQFRFACAAFGLSQYSTWFLEHLRPSSNQSNGRFGNTQ